MAEEKKKSIRIGKLLIAPIVTMLIGFGLLAYFGIYPLIRSVSCESTTATVIKYDYKLDDDDGELVCYTYEYYVNGVRYEKKSSYWMSPSVAPKLHSEFKISYNRRDPNNVFEFNKSTIGIACFGGLFFIVGIVIFIKEIKDIGKDKVEEGSTLSQEEIIKALNENDKSYNQPNEDGTENKAQEHEHVYEIDENEFKIDEDDYK